MNIPDKSAFNVANAAKYAKCGETMVLSAIRDGDLIAHYPSSAPVILRDDLVQWVKTLPWNQGKDQMIESYNKVIDEKNARIDDLERELAEIKKNTIVSVYKPEPKIDQLVYFIRCEGFVKIGISRDPKSRLRALQRSGNGTHTPKLIDLTTAELLATETGGWDREQYLHSMFASVRDVGEWFREAKELTEYIDGLLVKQAA